MRARMTARREALNTAREHTLGLIESRLDGAVRGLFANIHDAVPETLAELDAELERVVTTYLDALGVHWTRGRDRDRALLHVAASTRLPQSLRIHARAVVDGRLGAALPVAEIPLTVKALPTATSSEPAAASTSNTSAEEAGL